MPITQYDEPTHELTCDRCGIPPEYEDGGPALFVTREGARAWARDNGWRVGDEFLCPDDAMAAANEREHAEEIAAAVHYALTTPADELLG